MLGFRSEKSDNIHNNVSFCANKQSDIEMT